MATSNSETSASADGGEVRVPVLLRTSVKKTILTYTLIGLIAFFYLAQMISQWLLGGYDLLYLFGGKINSAIQAGQVWRLLTPIFLHGNLLHVGFNLYALYTIGPGLEKLFGHWRFLSLFLLGGFSGNVLSFLLSENPSLGASTAIFGLVAAQAVFILRNKKMYGSRARSLLINLALVLAVNLSLGLSPDSRIDNWGHLGGLAGGLIFAWLSGPVYQVQANPSGGLELVDQKTIKQVWLGGVITGLTFLIVAVIGFLI